MEKPQHDEIQRSLGRIEGKLGEMNNHLIRINGRLDKHGTNIGNLETEQSSIKTKVALFSSLAGVVVISVWEFFKNQWR